MINSRAVDVSLIWKNRTLSGLKKEITKNLAVIENNLKSIEAYRIQVEDLKEEVEHKSKELADKTKELKDNSELLQEKSEKLVEKEEENDYLKTQLAELKEALREKSEKHADSEERNGQLQSELDETKDENNKLRTIIDQKDFEAYLDKKSLPSLPQEKKHRTFSLKQSNLKFLGNKVKTSFHQLVTRIEVRTK